MIKCIVLCSLLTFVATSGILLPRRMSSEAEIPIALPSISDMQIDDTYNLAKDIVVQRRKLEADLARDGEYILLENSVIVSRKF